MSKLRFVFIGICAAINFTGCASGGGSSSSSSSGGGDGKYAGFLADYSGLEPIEGEDGEVIRRWLTSKNIKGKYPSLLVDPVVFHPEPQPTAQISEETLQGLRRYVDQELRRELAKSYTLVDRVGSGVARDRLALTSVSTKAEGLSAWEYVPFAAIAAGISAASGNRDEVASIVVEAEVTDSLSGEKIANARKVFDSVLK